MTMPTLIQKYQKKNVETHLARFYSIMSQAILRYQTDENMLGQNIVPLGSGKIPAEDSIKWFKDTIGLYIKTLSVDTDEQICGNGNYSCFAVKMADGSVFSGYVSGNLLHIFYCVNPNKMCKFDEYDGQNSFLFILNRSLYVGFAKYKNYSREKLLEECKYGNTDNPKKSSKNRRHACSALIQRDGWKIKDDYPWNQEFLEEN